MKHSTNYNFNLPDKADQYDLEHWNENTEKTDTLLKQVNDKLNTEITNRTNGDTEAKNLANATGILAIEKGGTGEATAKNSFMALANSLIEDENPADGEHIIFKHANGLNWGTYTFSKFWTYIRGKISSVLGLTASTYNGKANTAGTADTTKDINGLSVVKHYKTDNSGYPTYFITHDITDWVLSSSTSDVAVSGFSGFVFGSRDLGYNWLPYQQGNLFFSASYKPLQDTINLYYNNYTYTPVVIKNSSNKYFLAIKITGSGRICYFFGKWTSSITSTGVDSYIGTEILATDVEGTLPTGYTLVNSITNYAGNTLDLTPKYYDFVNVDLTDYATKTEVSDTYATKRDIETTNDLLLRFTRITRVTPPSFASLLGARALYSEDGGLKRIIVALKANQTYDSGNSTFSFSFIYGAFSTSMSTFIGGYCTTVPGDTSRNLALNSYNRSMGTGSGECVHTIKINNAGVEANDIITVYLNYL